MKLLCILAIILSLISSSLIAQEVTTNDTNDSVEVVITPKKGQDTTIVKVAGMKIIVLNDDKNDREIIIDDELGEENESGEENDDDNDDDDKVSHWAGVRIGVNGFLVDNALSVPSSYDFLELDYAKSISWDINFFEHDFRLVKNNVELVTGMGIHFASYSFKSKYATISNTEVLSTIVDSTRILEKNRLKATYLTVPLMLGFSTNQDEDKAVRLALGGQVSWRINSKLKQRYTENGETHKPKIKSDYDLNPFLFHAVASAGYGPINVYANYALNPLFESGKTLDVTPFDVGIQFMF
jgi:hypothetical protein